MASDSSAPDVRFSVELRRGVQEAIESLSDVGGALPSPVSLDETFPLMRLVDPYGMTYFSTRQMLGVVPELLRLRDRAGSREERAFLESVIQLARQCSAHPHSYLVFIGD